MRAWPQSDPQDPVRPAAQNPGHTADHTVARRIGRRRIGCGWPLEGRATPRGTERPDRNGDPGIPCGRQ
jgi:hypothetical protein